MNKDEIIKRHIKHLTKCAKKESKIWHENSARIKRLVSGKWVFFSKYYEKKSWELCKDDSPSIKWTIQLQLSEKEYKNKIKGKT